MYFLFQVFEDALEEAAPTEKQKKLKSRVVKKLPKFRLKEKAAAKNGNGDIEDSSQGPTLQTCFDSYSSLKNIEQFNERFY